MRCKNISQHKFVDPFHGVHEMNKLWVGKASNWLSSNSNYIPCKIGLNYTYILIYLIYYRYNSLENQLEVWLDCNYVDFKINAIICQITLKHEWTITTCKLSLKWNFVGNLLETQLKFNVNLCKISIAFKTNLILCKISLKHNLIINLCKIKSTFFIWKMQLYAKLAWNAIAM